ncbi:DUF4367 domain-containing protein [Virgibacillus doumboii]|uniref:DUF4367 domain-containing protein n=1 Tax=Virgibacillus doumboii TaxID=2697503 RepID=UPI0013DFA1C9|nr:DUF4367 domain-containing protein [Virgibacillus doumboii]
MRTVIVCFTIIFFSLIATACGNSSGTNDGDVTYGDEFKKKISEIEYTPELPTYIPYENYSKEVSILKSQNVISIMYKVKGKNKGVILEIFKGDANLINEGEEVALEEVNASFVKSENFILLTWKKDDLSYTLKSPMNADIDKNGLIKIANSFESIYQ